MQHSLYYLTDTKELLFIWPSAEIIPEQKRNPNLSNGLCWALPDSVLMLGRRGYQDWHAQWNVGGLFPCSQMLWHPLLPLALATEGDGMGCDPPPENRAPQTQERHWQVRKLWGIYPKNFLFHHLFAFRVVNKMNNEHKYICIYKQLPVSWLLSPNYPT